MELIGGAALGAVAGELLKAVLNVKEKASSFRPVLECLEFNLKSITLRLDEISRLDHKLDIQQHSMEELKILVNNGKSLVQMCSNVSRINAYKKVKYRNKLSDLDNSLKNYFTTLLPLDQFLHNLEMWKLVRELHKNLGGESVAPHNEGSVYQRKPGKKLFLLKEYPCDLDLKDLQNYDLISKGTYVTSYRCNTKNGDFLMKSINLEVKMTENEFKQRMEDIGKVGQHPNIMLPIGYMFSETAKYLFYEYAPASSLYALLKEPKTLGTRQHWDRSLKIVLGAARGISHIHSEGGVIHGNIKSSNVLVTADYDGRISDFGLAPMMNFPALNPELSAPELKETREATQKSDVYSFGVMLSEILNLYDNLWRHWLVALEQGEIKDIVRMCKDKNPEKRPKMDEVVKMIQQVQEPPSDN